MSDMDYDDLDPAVFCLTHGKPLLVDPFWGVTGGCDDCEGRPPTFDEALGAVCESREQMIEIQRTLK